MSKKLILTAIQKDECVVASVMADFTENKPLVMKLPAQSKDVFIFATVDSDDSPKPFPSTPGSVIQAIVTSGEESKSVTCIRRNTGLSPWSAVSPVNGYYQHSEKNMILEKVLL